MGVNKTVVTKWLEESGFTKWVKCYTNVVTVVANKI